MHIQCTHSAHTAHTQCTRGARKATCARAVHPHHRCRGRVVDLQRRDRAVLGGGGTGAAISGCRGAHTPQLAVVGHAMAQHAILAHRRRVEAPPPVGHPPDHRVRRHVQPRARAEVGPQRLGRGELDPAERLAAAAAAPAVAQRAELAAVVVARRGVEALARHVLGAARAHGGEVERRRAVRAALAQPDLVRGVLREWCVHGACACVTCVRGVCSRGRGCSGCTVIVACVSHAPLSSRDVTASLPPAASSARRTVGGPRSSASSRKRIVWNWTSVSAKHASPCCCRTIARAISM